MIANAARYSFFPEFDLIDCAVLSRVRGIRVWMGFHKERFARGPKYRRECSSEAVLSPPRDRFDLIRWKESGRVRSAGPVVVRVGYISYKDQERSK